MINATFPADGGAMLRDRIEKIIDHLIDLLDASEPDPDLEPSLGWNPYGCDDREYDGADEEGDELEFELDPADWGIADFDGLAEQTNGQLQLGGWLE